MNLRLSFVLAAAIAVFFAFVADVRGHKIKQYELAFQRINDDMVINYGLHQGALAALKECR